MPVVRVLTYNVRSLRDDPAVLCRLVRGFEPDVLVVQEAPRFLRWRPKCAALARECGLVYVAGGRPAGGNLLLAGIRVDVDRDSVVERRTPRAPLRPVGGLVAAVLEAGGARFGVVGCHLGLARVERRAEIAEVVEVAAALDAPFTVVGGDLNEQPGGPSWQTLAGSGFADPAPDAGPTFPSSRPRKRIDALLASDGVSVLEYGVPGDPALAGDYAGATDHRPVLAVLDVPAARAATL